MKNIVYSFSNSFFLTKSMCQRITRRLIILYPSNKSSIINKAERYLIKTYLLGALIIMGMWCFKKISLYYAILIGLTIMVIFKEKLNEDFSKLEYKILVGLLKFIEDVKFRFQFNGMLEQALIDSINDAEYEMSAHGQKIYECLMESYYFDKQDYMEISPNHFFLTFYSLCETVMLYGDKNTKQGSVFLKNLGYLKEEINIELLKRSKIQGNFLGLKGICIIPLFFIKPIEAWASLNIPELKDVFTGRFGIFTTIGLCVFALFMYTLINILKNGTFYKTPSSFVIELAKVKWINTISRAYIAFNIKSSNKIHKLITEIAYEYNLLEFTTKRIFDFVTVFAISAITLITIYLFQINDESIAGAILKSIGISIIIAVIVFIGEGISLKFRKQILLLEREEEIVRFQNIILMMMHMDKMTIEQILSKMERFAYVFKSLLQTISDRYTYKGVEALREAKNKCKFRPFERIMDGFIACDDTYIYEAFSDLEQDRRYFLDRHKQENERLILDKTTIAKVLSFMPLCLVIAIKLIIPFVLVGLKSLQSTDGLFM